MKNPLVMASVILLTVFSAAVFGELLGLRSNALQSFPAFIGLFTTAMVLSLVLHDYSRKPRAYAVVRQKNLTSATPRRGSLSRPPGAAWVYRTAS
jgi:hypothetical protein